MPIIDVSTAIGIILDKTVDGLIGNAQRHEKVIRVLRRLQFNPDNPPSDFDSLYTYTLVEYGIDKPESILSLFRHSIVRHAFRRTFEQRDPSFFTQEVTDFLQSNEGRAMYQLDYDPRQELSKFEEVFFILADRARTVQEVRQVHVLEDIHIKVQEALIRLEGLQQGQRDDYFASKPQPPHQTSSGLIFDVSTIIDYPLQQLERRFGKPAEIMWRKIGSAEDLPDGGETREYHVGKYQFDINYDKAGIAKGFHLFEGLEENAYSLDDWSEVLERVGLIIVRFPDMQGITTRIWTNHLGYLVKVATQRVGGPVTAVRVYKIPK